MMTTYKRLLLLAALPALLLASCSQEEPGNEPGTQNGAICFEIGFAPQTDAQTRVATDTDFNSTWENGDEIGIFAVEHGAELATSGNYIHNVKLTYRNGTWTPSKGIYWPKDGTKYDFYAYHPYDAALTDPTKYHDFYVQKDQSASTGGKSHFSLSDVMHAQADNNGSGYGRGQTVALNFKHLMAMVQVKVSSSMLGNYPPDALKVILQGCRTDKLSLKVSGGYDFGETTPVTITMYPCPNDGGTPGIYAYRALVPPINITAGTAMFRFEYGGNVLLRSKPLADGLPLKSGRVETFDMTFPFTSATVSSDVRLADLFTTKELETITHLKVLGEMKAADFFTISENMPLIANLDLGAATVEKDAIPISAFYGKTSLTEFVFPKNIKTIGASAFYYCNGLTGPLKIPQGVTTIGSSAFFECIGVTGPLTIPQGVTTIGDFAFARCSGFTGPLEIPQSVTTIGMNAFAGCSGFTGSLKIPQGVTTINDYAFGGCSGFTGSLTIPQGVTRIGNRAFDECSGFTGSLTIPQGVTTIGERAFNDCSGFTGPLIIPQGVTTIGNRAFNNCTGFTALTIHQGLTTIDYNAFSGCTGFKGPLIIPQGVTTIGEKAFFGCTGFTDPLIIPQGVTTIELDAFNGCTGFTALTIPQSVTKIGNRAFLNWTKYYIITCHVLEPDKVTYGSNVFDNNDSKYNYTPVYVPAAAENAYRSHYFWSRFRDIRSITQP